MKHKIPLSADGVFLTLQGEGVSIGKPSIFVRLQGCNLDCSFEDGSVCDASYTWDPSHPDFHLRSVYEVDHVIDMIFRFAEKTNRIVFTGGEPLLHQEVLISLLGELFFKGGTDWYIEVETNATIRPHRFDLFVTKFCPVFYNCSPKLQNANVNVLYDKQTIEFYSRRDSIFKFVVANVDQLKLVDEFVSDFSIPRKKVYIMPEGVSSERILSLQKELFDHVLDRGYSLTTRLQVLLFESKRGV